MTFPITALIVDDEPLGAAGVRRFCERSGRIAVVGEARDAPEALAKVERYSPQAIFLDIAMPGMTGLQLAALLGQRPEPPRIVFVTAHDHFAAEAFDLAVTDYVLKPLVADRMERAIERLCAEVERDIAVPRLGELWVPWRGALMRLPTSAIRRIDAERDYVRIHATERSYLLRATIGELSERLGPAGFLRVHRSTILPAGQIAAMRHVGSGAWIVIDQSGAEIAVGRTWLPLLKQHLKL